MQMLIYSEFNRVKNIFHPVNHFIILLSQKQFMPLYKTIHPREGLRIYVWEITETFDELKKGLSLSALSEERLRHSRSNAYKKSFVSVRRLLEVAGYSDEELYYTPDGKPHLKDGRRISITHSFAYSAIAVSTHPVGIDLEKLRPKIRKIRTKFIGEEEYFIDHGFELEYLTLIWSIKESLYKLQPAGGLSFRENMKVKAFHLSDGVAEAWLVQGKKEKKYRAFFEIFGEYVLVYTVRKRSKVIIWRRTLRR